MPEHSSLITALILERPMCLDCLARRAGMSVDAARTVLTVIGRALRLNRDDASPCRSCEKLGTVFHVERPAG
jgi:hypothetical protein